MDQMSKHSQHHPTPKPGTATEPPAAHGMAVIGEQAVYFSHLSMFSQMHGRQAVAEVELEGKGNPQEVYFEDRRNNPQQKWWTFNPVAFSLPAILPVGQSPPEATSFDGDLYRGHFERRETHPLQIAANVTVHVKNVIYHHKYEPNAPELEELQYIMFGRPPEIFLAHRINAAPDVDQIMSVDIDTQLSGEQLSNGIVVKIKDRPNTIAARIKPAVDVELPATAEIDGQTQPIKLRPKTEYLLEIDELAEEM